ncbi:MAG: hypothetical protein IPI21_16430 [Propionivibrio sp.]|nr:hypothetical protein [Propionivibrio sp.]
MAFVNEYVSDADVRTFALETLHQKWWGEIPPGFRYTWTVDREKNCYYIPLRTGREEFSNRTRGVLYFKEIPWEVEVSKEPGCSLSFDENPYRIVWGLVGIKNPEGETITGEELIPVLKKALTAYGYRGVHRQVVGSLTEFTF